MQVFKKETSPLKTSKCGNELRQWITCRENFCNFYCVIILKGNYAIFPNTCNFLGTFLQQTQTADHIYMLKYEWQSNAISLEGQIQLNRLDFTKHCTTIARSQSVTAAQRSAAQQSVSRNRNENKTRYAQFNINRTRRDISEQWYYNTHAHALAHGPRFPPTPNFYKTSTVITTSCPQNYTQLTPELVFSHTRQSISSGTVANGCFKWQTYASEKTPETSSNYRLDLQTTNTAAYAMALNFTIKASDESSSSGRTTSVAGFEGVRSSDGMGTGGG